MNQELGLMTRDDALKGDIERIVNDPAFSHVIELFQRQKLAQISSFVSDGSKEAENQLLEWCRELKTITDLNRTIKNDLSKLSERDSE